MYWRRRWNGRGHLIGFDLRHGFRASGVIASPSYMFAEFIMQSRPVAPTEPPEQVRAAMARGEILLVDVREPAEYARGHIDGAVSRPLSTLDPDEMPSGRPVVLYCESGKRAQQAYEICRLVDTPIRSQLAGGIQGWKAAGFAVIAGR